MWCLPEINAAYVDKMEDVLALYEKPYNPQEPVVCLDEKPVTLHAEVCLPRPGQPGVIAKRDSAYKRRGTANVFCAVEPKAGRHFSYPTPTRRGAEFTQVIKQLAGSYPRARTIHLVVDNLNIHCLKPLVKRFGEQRGVPISLFSEASDRRQLVPPLGGADHADLGV